MQLVFLVLLAETLSPEVSGFDLRKIFNLEEKKKHRGYGASSPGVQLLAIPNQAPLSYAIQSQPLQYVIREPTPQIIVRDQPQQIVVKEPEIRYVKQREPEECPKPEVKFIPIYLPQPMLPPSPVIPQTPSSSYGVPGITVGTPISSTSFTSFPLQSPPAIPSSFSNPNSFPASDYSKYNTHSKFVPNSPSYSNYGLPSTSSYSASLQQSNPSYPTYTTAEYGRNHNIVSPPSLSPSSSSRRKRSISPERLRDSHNKTSQTLYLNPREAALLLAFSKFSLEDPSGHCTAKLICNLIVTPFSRLTDNSRTILTAIRSPSEYLFGVTIDKRQNTIPLSTDECQQLYRKCHLKPIDVLNIIEHNSYHQLI